MGFLALLIVMLSLLDVAYGYINIEFTPVPQTTGRMEFKLTDMDNGNQPVIRNVQFKLYQAITFDKIEYKYASTFVSSEYQFINLDPASVYLLIGKIEGVNSNDHQQASTVFRKVGRTFESDTDVVSGLTRITNAEIESESALMVALESTLNSTFGAQPIARPMFKTCSNITFRSRISGDLVNPSRAFRQGIQKLPYGTKGVKCDQVCALNYMFFTDPESKQRELFHGSPVCYDFKKTVRDSVRTAAPFESSSTETENDGSNQASNVDKSEAKSNWDKVKHSFDGKDLVRVAPETNLLTVDGNADKAKKPAKNGNGLKTSQNGRIEKAEETSNIDQNQQGNNDNSGGGSKLAGLGVRSASSNQQSSIGSNQQRVVPEEGNGGGKKKVEGAGVFGLAVGRKEAGAPEDSDGGFAGRVLIINPRLLYSSILLTILTSFVFQAAAFSYFS